MPNPKLTIFTPVYNRAYIIANLYNSLCRQTSNDFEWIVVDDGSTDEVDDLINKFIEEASFTIRYYKQTNGGKHRAINKGVLEAKGELFFIVDSDDYLTDDAVEWVVAKSHEIIDNDSFVGISGLRVEPNGHKIGGENNFTQIDADAISIRVKHHVTGDLAEIYKTEILKKFPFPDIPNEKFCSEGLIWNRIAMTGKQLRYCYKPLYVCEYLGDGLTAGRVKCRRESPEYSLILYSEALNNPILPIKDRLKYGILFWRYAEKSKRSLKEKCKMIRMVYWPLIIPGILIRQLKH